MSGSGLGLPHAIVYIGRDSTRIGGAVTTGSKDTQDAESIVQDLFYGRWRSQTVFAGLKLGVFEAVTATPIEADKITADLAVDRALGARLLRWRKDGAGIRGAPRGF